MATSFTLPRFSQPDGLKSVAPDLLIALLDPYRDYFERRDLSLPPSAEAGSLDIEGLAKVLMAPVPETPARLLDALYHIHEMATPDGMDALLAEVRRQRLSVDLGERPTPTDVAARLWLSNRDLLERTHAEAFLCRPRSFEYYQSDPQEPPKTPTLANDKLGALEAELDAWFEAKKRGRGTRVFPFPKTDGIWFLIRHGEPYKREGTLDREQSSSVVYRPEKHDVLVYDPALGELRINAASKGEKDLYRREFGHHLFGHESHFPGGQKYTLEPLRTDGPASLTCTDVSGIDDAVLKELQLYWGGAEQEVETRRSTDVFATLAKRGRPIPRRPRLIGAKFEMKFSDSKKSRRVELRPPNIARYTRDGDGAFVDEWLILRGFALRRPGSE